MTTPTWPQVGVIGKLAQDKVPAVPAANVVRPGDHLTDESGNRLTDELADELTG